ncbi:hypothetical protein A2U01_0092156, partial [Trifolium medium]|nr:hypothetical protein [Trifolium medium]
VFETPVRGPPRAEIDDRRRVDTYRENDRVTVVE